ncbi:MAG: DEAD/DEAH box helicase [Leptospiraceae bacterium]|nr:DEAD/DEAH box helicase [Leptospiraceae bacterium]MDW8306320.1 DEAD/DEAH box helicase [Leptospiraceae bacterium]
MARQVFEDIDAKPLIVQSDKTLLLEVDHPLFEEARAIISRFAELEKSPEYLHTYRITPLSLWNAAAAKMKAEEIIDALYRYSKYPVPQVVNSEIVTQISRYGKLKLKRDEQGNLILYSKDTAYIKEVLRHKKIQPYLEGPKDENTIYVKNDFRGHLKQALIKIGYPVEDLAGYDEGNAFKFNLREYTRSGKKFEIRDYQRDAIEAFYAGGSVEGGSGVIVLPCGAGKTIVGIGCMHAIGTQTLILVTNTLSIRQWKQELLDKTDIKESDIGEYSGEKKEIRPITIATYNILTHRRKKGDEFTHFRLFSSNNWGFIIYDEVHLLPAPVFRMTSELQAKRRLGLTATLVREDGLEDDVFSLIGPKKYDVPWKDLEKKQWIAEARCIEVRVPMREMLRNAYSVADDREKFRLSSENPEKTRVVGTLLHYHRQDQVLIIGQYLNQLKRIAGRFGIPLITGKTPLSERERLYREFREKKIPALVVSKVANFSIDLPDANVAIQVSGTFGSRQEEAQRLGRVLRPKEKGLNQALFYSVVTNESTEERFAHNRQLFLTEQGYEYFIYSYEQFKEVYGNYLKIIEEQKKQGTYRPIPPKATLQLDEKDKEEDQKEAARELAMQP